MHTTNKRFTKYYSSRTNESLSERISLRTQSTNYNQTGSSELDKGCMTRDNDGGGGRNGKKASDSGTKEECGGLEGELAEYRESRQV